MSAGKTNKFGFECKKAVKSFKEKGSVFEKAHESFFQELPNV